MRRSSLWRWFAHSHWISMTIFHKEIRLCARCTGTILGFLFLLILVSIFDFSFFNSLSFNSQMIVCILFIMPVSFDWLSQAWKLREGKNKYRITTGFSEGFGVALFSLIGIPLILKIGILVIISMSIINLGLYGKHFFSRKLVIKNQHYC